MMVASSVCMKKPTATSHSRLLRVGLGVQSCGQAERQAAKSRPKAAFGQDADARQHQAEKLEPQPQVLVAFGFLITNWAPCRSSL